MELQQKRGRLWRKGREKPSVYKSLRKRTELVCFCVCCCSPCFQCFCCFLVTALWGGGVFALFQGVLQFYSMFIFVEKEKHWENKKTKTKRCLKKKNMCLPLFSFVSPFLLYWFTNIQLKLAKACKSILIRVPTTSRMFNHLQVVKWWNMFHGFGPRGPVLEASTFFCNQ